jgi:excisionase family DNA binding protein
MHYSSVEVTGSEEFLSRSRVAKMFSVSPSTVTRWADEGKLTYIRTLGGHRRYQKEGIIELVRMLNMEERVKTITVEIPRLYGDHHTTAVRQALSQLPGVQEVWASAASKQVWVTFDPDLIQSEDVIGRLAEAGYPTQNGAYAQTVPAVRRDPAWAKQELRMTQTNSTGP